MALAARGTVKAIMIDDTSGSLGVSTVVDGVGEEVFGLEDADDVVGLGEAVGVGTVVRVGVGVGVKESVGVGVGIGVVVGVDVGVAVGVGIEVGVAVGVGVGEEVGVGSASAFDGKLMTKSCVL